MQLLSVGLNALRVTGHRLIVRNLAFLDRQLAALRQRCGGGTPGSHLSTAAQLQAAWAALSTEQCDAGVRQGHPQAILSAFGEQSARILLGLEPDKPRSSYERGNALENVSAFTAAHWQDALPHYQRGAELARAQGSDFWLARWAVLSDSLV